MKTVREVSRLTGVSIRTLHHYDSIGLLKPARISPAGYRMYDDACLQKLQRIMLLRELRFSLGEIREILSSPSYNPEEAIARQIELLEMEQKRIGNLIALAREIQQKGVSDMNFKPFDRSEMDGYRAEARERWGETAAYREFEQKKADFDASARDMMAIFAEIGALKQLSPADEAVQEKIAALQAFISQNYYSCTKEILKGLGIMYVQDERFRKNIDRSGGTGTAEFAARAIEIYCG